MNMQLEQWPASAYWPGFEPSGNGTLKITKRNPRNMDFFLFISVPLSTHKVSELNSQYTIFSPKPINLTGISNSLWIARTTPPRCSTNLGQNNTCHWSNLENSLAWTRAFVLLKTSKARKVSWEQLDLTRLIIRPIFSNSAGEITFNFGKTSSINHREYRR